VATGIGEKPHYCAVFSSAFKKEHSVFGCCLLEAKTAFLFLGTTQQTSYQKRHKHEAHSSGKRTFLLLLGELRPFRLHIVI